MEGHRRSLEAARLAGMMARAHLPKRHAQLGSLSGDGPWSLAWRDVEGLLGSGSIVGLIGGRGTGKTQLASQAARETIQRAIGKHGERVDGMTPALYTTAMGMYLSIREGYKQDGPSEKSLIDQFARPDLLIIDEIQERGETEWEDRVLVHICDRRYGDLKDTILIGNGTTETLAKGLGPSIMSRMQECGQIIVCDWPSFRGKAGATA